VASEAIQLPSPCAFWTVAIGFFLLMFHRHIDLLEQEFFLFYLNIAN